VARPSIAIVGAGRAGSAIAQHLRGAGYTIREIVSRSNPRSLAAARKLARRLNAAARTAAEARLDAKVVWFFVPDAKIGEASAQLLHRDWSNKVAFHASGALTSEALASLRQRGARAASVHPLMTFVGGSATSLERVPFAVEGDTGALRSARAIVRDLKGEVLQIRKQDKVAYHAFATMVCPLLVSLLASAEDVARLAGLSNTEARRRMMPIVRQTLANVEKWGPAGSFSGPIVRGDVDTIRRHAAALSRAPAAKHAYLALAKAALRYLPHRNRREMTDLLERIIP
jgi:predicted short-subunit dehydrogenase-like oxidoreductase (DUF2520 family)